MKDVRLFLLKVLFDTHLECERHMSEGSCGGLYVNNYHLVQTSDHTMTTTVNLGQTNSQHLLSSSHWLETVRVIVS